MPICIAGMHRSGTSMVARLLHLCGLRLGPVEELEVRGPDNEEGFWENRRFVEIDEEILERLGGGWDLPPRFLEGWENRTDLEPLRARGRSLAQSFSGGGTWGWKDPRSSLTLPFWKMLVPDLKVVVCLRNPLEVQRSLAKRGHSSVAFGLRLWHDYSRRVIIDTTPGGRVLTHYDAYFAQPRAELERVCSLAGLRAHGALLDRAAAAASAALRHNRFSGEDLLSANVPSDVLSLYAEMCEEAGMPLGTPFHTSMAPSAPRVRAESPSPEAGEVLVNLLRERLALKERSLVQVVEEKQIALLELAESERRERDRRAELAAITGSTGWIFLQLLRDVRLRCAPHGSRREGALLAALRGLRLWRDLGTRTVLARLRGRPARWWSRRRSWGPGSSAEALATDSSTHDVICFPVIDWEFRFQRPQQLLRQFATNGHRVFYLRTRFHVGGEARLQPIGENIRGVELPGPRGLNIYSDPMSAELQEGLVSALEELRSRARIEIAVCIVQLPFWAPLALAARNRFGWKVVYDCIDDHAGFSTNSAPMLRAEEDLIRTSDLAVASSHRLLERVSSFNDRTLLLPNAGDFDHFRDPGSDDPLAGVPHPIVGYYGAISEWFDVEMVRTAASARPRWQFVLIGDTFGADVSALRGLQSVHLLGEKPYASLPAYLHRFDVACIPFRDTPLTRATNPLKFYEYLSAGKPVVAVALPELEPFRELFYPVSSGADFVPQIEAALRERSPETVRARIRFAKANTWAARHRRLDTAIRELYGRVAIVIVSYNNLSYLRQCLESLWARTLHPNFEVIVVDNGSGPEVAEYLGKLAESEARLRVILNGANLGFARASNIGIAAAAECSHLVLLNDDTVVTHGWLPRMIRYMDRSDVGLVGPVTNWCGNEARIEVGYRSLDGLEGFARRHVREHEGRFFDIPMLAMYCLGLRRSVFDEVGPLDERFGVGMFEDDDYSLRVKRHGHRVICAEDVYVHHWGRASFSRIEAPEYRRLFEENRRKFEEKWGTVWEPHKARVRESR